MLYVVPSNEKVVEKLSVGIFTSALETRSVKKWMGVPSPFVMTIFPATSFIS